MNCEAVLNLLSENNWSLATSLGALVVGVIAICVAIWQLRVGRTETRSAQAHETYQQYLARCIEYPEFASGYASDVRPDPKYDQYKWFVASMLFSFEQIMEAKPKDKYWVAAIGSQLEIHRLHLSKSNSVRRGEWDDSLQQLLNKVVGDERK